MIPQPNRDEENTCGDNCCLALMVAALIIAAMCTAQAVDADQLVISDRPELLDCWDEGELRSYALTCEINDKALAVALCLNETATRLRMPHPPSSSKCVTRGMVLHHSPRLLARKGEDYVNELASLLEEYSAEHELDLAFMVTLAYCESGFNQHACNESSGCAGIFQLHPCHGLANVYDLRVNVSNGCQIFRRYLDRAGGDEKKALMRWGLTSSQARRVLAMREDLENELGAN